jgi:hypothetical protein
MENVQNTYQSDILGTAVVHNTRFKASVSDVVEEVVDQLDLPPPKFREALPGIDPQDTAIARLTILQKTFKSCSRH